jgi:porphobilinogen synthase
MFPEVRLRRLRQNAWLRDLVAETNLSPENLIYPIFIVQGHGIRENIVTMPGVARLSIDYAIEEIKACAKVGIKAVALFPVVDNELKDSNASEAYNLDNLICRSIRAIKNANIDIGIIADVALDPYTLDGHDGITVDGEVDNDATIECLCNQALALAKAGVDMVAPSDMMDGRVGAIRQYLDEADLSRVNILAYSVKHASSLYYPFRDALGNKASTDKKTYQMDYRNFKETLREIELDILEGADIVMVKPAITSLDIIHAAANQFTVPIFAYQVSGEYAMIKSAAMAEYLLWDEAILESLISIKRAGARAIVSYAALDVAKRLAKI